MFSVGTRSKDHRPLHTPSRHPMPFNAQGIPYAVVEHEYDVEHDPKGDTKVDSLGHLLGGRSYRVRSFVLHSRDNKLFMLAHEAARCVGVPDAYALFRRYPRLYKIRLTVDDSPEYAGKYAVTARSIFIEFGALVTVGGRRVIDDYYENESLQKYQYNELADPQDRLPPPGESYNVEQWANSGAETPLPQSMTQDTWLTDHAQFASRYNSYLNRQRAKLWTPKGVYEGNTGLSFYAHDSQPRNPRWKHRSAKGGKITLTTVITSRHRIAKTGLAQVDASIYEGLDESIKKAIKEQIEYEKME